VSTYIGTCTYLQITIDTIDVSQHEYVPSAILQSLGWVSGSQPDPENNPMTRQTQHKRAKRYVGIEYIPIRNDGKL
jgi:hypothetical protein